MDFADAIIEFVLGDHLQKLGGEKAFPYRIWRDLRKFFMFTVCITTELTPSFHKENNISVPVNCTNKLIRAGRTSLERLVEVYTLDGSELLQRTRFVFVFVDPNTRKPCPVPSNIREVIEQSKLDSHDAMKIEPLQKPVKFGRATNHVTWSDINNYGVASQKTFYRFALDAMVEVGLKDQFTFLKGNTSKYPLRRVNVQFRKESFVDDILDIILWENESDPLTLHALIEKNGTRLFECTYTFADTPATPKAKSNI